MIRGLGRVIVITAINFVIVYTIVAIVMSSIFSIFAYEQLKMMVQEMVQARTQQIMRQYRNAPPEVIQKIISEINESLWRQYGLTQPLHERVLIYTWRLILFNLSGFAPLPQVSYPVPGENALEITLNALVRTAILFTTAAILNMFINIFLGLQAAKRAGSLFDRALAFTALISYSLPMWWTGLILIYIFAYTYRIFPMGSIEVLDKIKELEAMNLPPWEYFINYILTWARYMALPIITIMVVSFGGGAYVTRSMVLTVSREDFVIVARAKGLPERTVLYKHILRAASPPIVTGIIFGLIGSLGGAIISERVFQWPGMGFVYWIALSNSDASILLVNTWVITIMYIAAYFILDFIYMLLDPRVRVGKGVE